MKRLVIGIDNGTSGTLGIIGGPQGPLFENIPCKQYLMGKGGRNVARIDHDKLKAIIASYIVDANTPPWDAHAYIERPFTGGPAMIQTMLAARAACEATIIVCEQLEIGHTIIDSRDWQKPILGERVKGSAALKAASAVKGCQLYPQFRKCIDAHGDADGLLIAHRYTTAITHGN